MAEVRLGIEYEKVGISGRLTFKTIIEPEHLIEEGDRVSVRVDDRLLFVGYVFSRERNKDEFLTVMAYNQWRGMLKIQKIRRARNSPRERAVCPADFTLSNMALRYFKNKDVRVVSKLSASGILKDIAADFKLETGTIEETGYMMSRIVNDESLFDIIWRAIEETQPISNQGREKYFHSALGALRGTLSL